MWGLSAEGPSNFHRRTPKNAGEGGRKKEADKGPGNRARKLRPRRERERECERQSSTLLFFLGGGAGTGGGGGDEDWLKANVDQRREAGILSSQNERKGKGRGRKVIFSPLPCCKLRRSDVCLPSPPRLSLSLSLPKSIISLGGYMRSPSPLSGSIGGSRNDPPCYPTGRC